MKRQWMIQCSDVARPARRPCCMWSMHFKPAARGLLSFLISLCAMKRNQAELPPSNTPLGRATPFGAHRAVRAIPNGQAGHPGGWSQRSCSQSQSESPDDREGGIWYVFTATGNSQHITSEESFRLFRLFSIYGTSGNREMPRICFPASISTIIRRHSKKRFIIIIASSSSSLARLPC